MSTIEFNGKKIKYDPKAIRKWSVQRGLVTPGAETFASYDAILCGKADEVAELLGDDLQQMVDLMLAISEKESGEAKN